jgi:two-component system sensor histidine kinase/response regulator
MHRSWLLWVLIVTSVCLAHTLYPEGIAGNSTYLLLTSGAAVVAWIGASRQPAHRRFAWRLVAVGVSCSAAGDLIYYVRGLINDSLPDVSAADAFWLAA